MKTITSFIKRHPLATFFVLAYSFSWGTYALLGGPFLFPFGPLFAALFVASLTRGKAGLNDLLSRSLRWRVGLRWYAAALGVPVAIGLAAASLNTVLGAPLPTVAQLGPWYSLFFLFPMALFDAPLQEEIGWRGYALPQFPAGRSPLANTLMLAVLLAGWHAPVALSGGSAAVPYLIAGMASMVLTNWVYYNARASALLAIVYHTAGNTLGLYYAQLVAGPDLTRYFWLLAAVNSVVAAGVVLVTGPSLRRRAATHTTFPETSAGEAAHAVVSS